MTSFTRTQVEQLLRPVHVSRVMRDGKNKEHLSQQDVTAHLIRVFGFGNFDTTVLSAECIFEHNRPTSDGKPSARWDIGYRALVRLTVRNPAGQVVCRYENGSTGTAQNQSLGDGHDLAYKSAISLAMKRCAINLGDQFGLSLYNKGQLKPLVMDTLVRPDGEAPAVKDMQDGVPEQVASDEAEISGEPSEKPSGLSAALSDKGPSA